MAKTYSYADAVRLLGKRESALVTALDRLAGFTLLGGAAGGVSELLGWFDAKTDFVRLSHELLVKAGEKRSGLSRYSRTERLHAAHTVIVVVALFEAFEQVELPFRFTELGLGKDEQRTLVGLNNIFDGEGVLPSAHRPYEQNLLALEQQYEGACRGILRLVRDRAVWALLSGEQRDRTERVLSTLHKAALTRYEELVRKLGAEYHELAFWLQADQNAHISAGLTRLEEALTRTRVGAEPDERRRALANRYRAVLDRPIIDPGQVPAGLEIPITRHAYVDPDYQVVPMTQGAHPAELGFWCAPEQRSDLYQYLVGHLTSPKAVSHPLVVLGDPGSGKSLLTKVLAARLPASDFLTVRVELRSVAAEADLRRQIDQGLSLALHEDVSFAAMARAAGDALPVVLLDGFDELLQATGVSQTDFLHRVQTFQRDHADAGHPVAVVVTSRISVAGGMQIPLDTDVLRLAPFTDANVAAWLEVWNSSNEDYFRHNEVLPLTAGAVIAHHDLAEQPLLLLMLALYDAVGNALQRHHDSLGRIDLYEKLLRRFARREVDKGNDVVAADDDPVEVELEKLSVVAFAMFQRGTKWVAGKAIDQDLTALLRAGVPQSTHGMRTPLSEGDRIVGRFFFVQCATATRDKHLLHTYEFLHATFGEFLVARFIWCVLSDLRERESSGRRITGAQPDDSLLWGLLSFAPLTSSNPVIEFLMEMAGADKHRDALKTLVQRLFALAQIPRARSLEAYQPVRRPAPARYAIYSLNLVVLHVVLDQCCSSHDIGVPDWSKLTTFWKSQLSDAEWRTLIESLYVRRDTPPHVVLAIGTPVPTTVEQDGLAGRVSLSEAALDVRFTGDPAGSQFKHAFEALPEHRLDVDYARALIQLTASPAHPADRARHYLRWADRYPDLVLECLRRDITVGVQTLERLATTKVGTSSAFVVQLCDRIGRGGPDAELLGVLGSIVTSGSEVPMLDAFLRLHEGSYRDCELDLRIIFASVDFERVGAHRPDLVYRAGTVAHDIGLFD
ncbi:NACHT domain-containing NTPase [Nocardia sp. NRRL S-836]|uniref:NACHT domain-containing protein n=1 Tax=Nocardia sp. NRRL S-836 TaxID=1519492 RepID=UPI0006AEB9FF|nr:AAA family ATPase [Nocardia sp. NRRL S-836]